MINSEVIEYFDPFKITHIKFIKEKDAGYVWVDEIPDKKYFFGLFTKKGNKSGFLNRGEISTKEQLLRYGYKIYDNNERINSRVVTKPYIQISLVCGDKINIGGETEKDLRDYIDDIIGRTNLKFETN
jgi:hypothetical protein